ncbi:hypothetical protein PPYR_14958 [Photinus pyralis]|uniref:Methyltransferase domain-containing protein n=1 Tax=Photinus pyralis TaxID=7054 RepID=A0A5N4A0P4_PHOPY|nr:ATP synthase subunit C lysine N-methyltransferase [Photinus pyralis]KAB0790871.1 hypothetical protein PPYR_14958 [Photinus pyralis]
MDFNFSTASEDPEKSTFGYVLLTATGGLLAATCLVTASFVSPAFRKHCLPFVPATNQQVRNVLLALKNRKGPVIDIGSGDGRIVLELAKNNYDVHGVELNPWLVAYSRIAAFCGGLNVKFYVRDLWKFRLSAYDNIVIFGVEQMMVDFERKLVSECKEDCNVVACRFPLPNMTPERVIGIGIDKVWVYVINKRTIV